MTRRVQLHSSAFEYLSDSYASAEPQFPEAFNFNRLLAEIHLLLPPGAFMHLIFMTC